jgi:NCS1 family nucleobase:cation symporter-1
LRIYGGSLSRDSLLVLIANVRASPDSPIGIANIVVRAGGLITGIIGVLMMPWKLVADPSGYIFTWLVGYSALLGPIGGIMIADYFVLRRRHLNLDALYQHDSEHGYTHGFSIVALVSLLAAILPNLPGFLVTVKLIEASSVPAFFVGLYSYAWFVGFGIAFVLYIALRKTIGGRSSATPATDSQELVPPSA